MGNCVYLEPSERGKWNPRHDLCHENFEKFYDDFEGDRIQLPVDVKIITKFS